MYRLLLKLGLSLLRHCLNDSFNPGRFFNVLLALHMTNDLVSSLPILVLEQLLLLPLLFFNRLAHGFSFQCVRAPFCVIHAGLPNCIVGFFVLKLHKLHKVKQAVKRTCSIHAEAGSCTVSRCPQLLQLMQEYKSCQTLDSLPLTITQIDYQIFFRLI